MVNSNNQFIIAKILKQDMFLETKKDFFFKPQFFQIVAFKRPKSQFLQTLNNYNTLIHFIIDQLLKNQLAINKGPKVGYT